MVKKVSKILFSIILIMMLAIQLMPINVFAAKSDEQKTLESNIDAIDKKYDILEASDKLSDKKFEEWSNAVIYFLKYALGDDLSDYVYGIGQRATSVANNGNIKDTDKKKIFQEAKKIMEALWHSTTTIASYDDMIVTSTDVNFTVFKIGEISINKGQVKRLQSFREKIIGSIPENDKLGSTVKYAFSAFLTYRGILAELGDDSGVGFTKSLDEKLKFSADEIRQYYLTYGYNYSDLATFSTNRKTLEAKWLQTLKNANINVSSAKDYAKKEIKNSALQNLTEEQINQMDRETQGAVEEDKDKDTVFQQPKNITGIAKNGADDVINDADKFISDGNNVEEYLSTGDLQDFSQTLYGILLGLGIIIAVLAGALIGIKLMLSPVEQKAEAKKMLVPYIAGCIIVFGAFGIWQIVVTIMQQV